jgi:hypothetical protein
MPLRDTDSLVNIAQFTKIDHCSDPSAATAAPSLSHEAELSARQVVLFEIMTTRETSYGIDPHHHRFGVVVWRRRILGASSRSLVGDCENARIDRTPDQILQLESKASRSAPTKSAHQLRVRRATSKSCGLDV